MKASLLSLSLLLLALTTASPLANPDVPVYPTFPTKEMVAITDIRLFSDSLERFMQYREQKNPATLDWTSNGCSYSPDYPLGFKFHDACVRHDFGYRNYKKQRRWTKEAKEKIDWNFSQDMNAVCKKYHNPLEMPCQSAALMYYEAVKHLGS